VRFRAEDGTIGSPLCTDLSDKNAAEQWAVEKLLAGQTEKIKRPRIPLFKEWATPWWVFDSCPYIAEKMANGFNISRGYAAVRRSYLTRYLIPAFGDFNITELKPRHFRDFKMNLYNRGDLSPATINRILGTARVMFNYAVSMGKLESNPVAPIKELKETPVERGILTLDEVKILFGSEAFKTIWNGDIIKHYAANLLAASTGMRLGEIQALQIQYVRPTYIEVKHSWDDRFGLSDPKWGSFRFVPVPRKTAEALSQLISLNRWGDPLPTDIVFWSKDRNTPLTKTAILKQFKAALGRIGISEEDRKKRVLLFHGYRHLFNTLIRGQVPDEQLRRVTGHKTLSMSNNYDHARPEHLQDVAAAQERIFRLP
jgi:integrase